jgi:acyl-CoA synthetase (NDP forming)
MGELYQYQRFGFRSHEGPAPTGKAPDMAEKLIQSAGQAGLDEFQAKEILKSYGVPVAREALAMTLQEVKARSDEIGYPVALRCVRADLHKTELGLVNLNVKVENVTVGCL